LSTLEIEGGTLIRFAVVYSILLHATLSA
jgi:hypothetical protein